MTHEWINYSTCDGTGKLLGGLKVQDLKWLSEAVHAHNEMTAGDKRPEWEAAIVAELSHRKEGKL